MFCKNNYYFILDHTKTIISLIFNSLKLKAMFFRNVNRMQKKRAELRKPLVVFFGNSLYFSTSFRSQ